MDALTLVITILQLLCGLAVIVIVLFQSGKSAGLSGAIGGVADSFLSRNKAKTLDAKLARATKWCVRYELRDLIFALWREVGQAVKDIKACVYLTNKIQYLFL